MNVSMKQKQTHRYREQICVYQQRAVQGGKKIGAWDQQMQTNIYGLYKPQGPAIQHWELCSISCKKSEWKRI